jgi:hypothetical protein
MRRRPLYLREQVVDASSFGRIPLRSKELVRSALFGASETGNHQVDFLMEMPSEAAMLIVPGSGFFGRVLGWAEQKENSFAIRAIAVAQVNAFIDQETPE